uniref:Uncharacterized protein n=1 Tax=Pyramimonas obovata TaxID=1411642 RepID=A0A7S0RXA4_9CHLO|mmetsp:Transcript_8433/g.17444  ORF Transcript_8433/g.17444 Transcript_8433/m.17444 type:complete len:148 (+) Transcript_8433:84-527(+)
MAIITKDADGKTMFLGINRRNWSIIVGGLLTLYLCLGLMYYALLSIAIECRGEEYLKMPKEFFGDFSREKYYAHYGSPTEDKEYPVYPWVAMHATGCQDNMATFNETGKDIEMYSCDPECNNLVYHSICNKTDTCLITAGHKQCLNP